MTFVDRRLTTCDNVSSQSFTGKGVMDRVVARCLALGPAILLLGVLVHAQVPEPIPPPLTPNTTTGGFNSFKGTLRAKSSPDECWFALGKNTRLDFPNQATCPNGQIPKV